MEMDSEQVLTIIASSLSTFATFATLVVATVVFFVLWRRKEGGAGGAFLLVLARTGVWLFSLGILFIFMLQRELDIDLRIWVPLGLRGFLALSTLLTIPAFLLIKAKEA